MSFYENTLGTLANVVPTCLVPILCKRTPRKVVANADVHCNSAYYRMRVTSGARGEQGEAYVFCAVSNVSTRTNLCAAVEIKMHSTGRQH